MVLSVGDRRRITGSLGSRDRYTRKRRSILALATAKQCTGNGGRQKLALRKSPTLNSVLWLTGPQIFICMYLTVRLIRRYRYMLWRRVRDNSTKKRNGQAGRPATSSAQASRYIHSCRCALFGLTQAFAWWRVQGGLA
jgi:hypothetical protein